MRPLLYLHPGFWPGPSFRKKSAKDVVDTGDGTPFAACDHRDPCRLVTMGNYIHIWVDIDFVRQIACDHEDLFLNVCRFLPTLVQAILAKKVRSPHPQLSLINIDSPARPAVPGRARSRPALPGFARPCPDLRVKPTRFQAYSSRAGTLEGSRLAKHKLPQTTTLLYYYITFSTLFHQRTQW